MEELKRMYYDPKQGFIGIPKLIQKLKDKNIKISSKDVKDYYDSLPTTQIMRPLRKPKKFNSIVANYNGDIYQMDIMVYNRFKYNNYQYILCVIDIYSRYASVRAMTNRKMDTIITNFNDIVKEMGAPRKLQCDNEFNKKEFIHVLEEDNITTVFSDPDEINKNAIVERFNGTLANLLQKIRLSLNRYDWNIYIKDAIYNYNHTIHSTTKHTPNDIWTEKAQNDQVIIKVATTFKVGDKVRIMRKSKAFDKGDVIKYSPEIYIIENVSPQGNLKLIGIVRKYKPYEVKKISDIIEHIHLQEPKTEIKENKIQQFHKREGIDTSNIIVGKRIRNKINN
jgi:hypothetical protein